MNNHGKGQTPSRCNLNASSKALHVLMSISVKEH